MSQSAAPAPALVLDCNRCHATLDLTIENIRDQLHVAEGWTAPLGDNVILCPQCKPTPTH